MRRYNAPSLPPVSPRTSRAGSELTVAAENERLTDCFHETKDWRACTAEVRRSLTRYASSRLEPSLTAPWNPNTIQMTAFRDCWQKHSNDRRTDMKDADKE